MGVIMLIISLVQIVGRYVFFYSISWSEELTTYIYVWIIFLSLHLAAKNRNELSIDTYTPKNERSKRMFIFWREIFGFVTCFILLVGSIWLIQNSFKYPNKTASLGINVVGLYFCMPICFGLIAFQKLTNILQDIVYFNKGDGGTDTASAK